jgi:hypothetical protein
MKFTKGPDQVYFFILMIFSYLIFKKAYIGGIEDLELLILELLIFGVFSAHFDLAGLNQRQ